MKLSEAPSKIVGVHLGEASLNLMGTASLLKSKFALLTKDGDACGFMEVSQGWSEKTVEALKVFAAALEEEALALIMESKPQPEQPANPEAPNEPPQF